MPFCTKKCSYCDFHFSTRFESYRTEMIQAISEELSERKNELNSPLCSIYFGGGTPSVLTKKELSLLLNSIYKNFSVSETLELSLEANPENVSFKNAYSWKELGFNRLSIGIQSFKKEDLIWMNRNHTIEDSLSCVSTVQTAGFNNVSLDLMYGLPGLSQADWLSFLKIVVSMGVQHLSAYCLTVEDKTKLKREIDKGRLSLLSEEHQVEQFKVLVSFLKNSGFEQYEVSNFAKNKNYSIHNMSYWNRISYIGVGPSAHSFDGKKRRWNIASNKVYLTHKKQGKKWYEEETLSKKAKWNELFLTGLRTKWGVCKKEINHLGGFISSEKDFLRDCQKKGFIVDRPSAFVLSDYGMLFADGISEGFFRVL